MGRKLFRQFGGGLDFPFRASQGGGASKYGIILLQSHT